MSIKTNYSITAFDTNGKRIYSEHSRTLAIAHKVARELLAYGNVATVDVDRDNVLVSVARYVKNNGMAVRIDGNGNVANIRI